MLKKQFSATALLAIVLAVSVAFATKVNADWKEAKQTSYFWFNAAGTYQAQNTVSAERSRVGCNDLTTITCESAYSSSQLVNPSQPSQGLKANQTPQMTIRKDQ